jgi:phage baseplate assembly protein W
MAIDRAALFGNDLQVAERAGGMDLLRERGGDLALTGSVPGGNDNIVQALALRLRVRKGELARLGWADYGSRLHELIGEPNNTRTHVKLMAFARAAIEQDPRVREVASVEAQVIPGEREVVRLLMEITLIDASNPLNLVFDVKLN